MTPCAECGQPHVTRHGGPACTGHANVKDDDGNIIGKRPCRRPGPQKCAHHGGGAPQVKAKRAREAAEAKAAAVLRRFGEPIDTTPTEALLDAVKWTAGYVAWLREKVAAAKTDDELVWGTTKETDDAVVVGTGPKAYVEHVTKQTRESGANAWLALLGEWHDRLVRICAEAIKAGIEERRVRLAEQQGQLVADVIRTVLARLNLTAEQQQLAGEVVPFELRRLAG